MNRRNFITALMAVPIMGKALSAFANQKNENKRPFFSGHWTATVNDLLIHCRRTRDALAVVVTSDTRSSKILREIEKADGVTRAKRDHLYRPYLWVASDDGGWSQVKFITPLTTHCLRGIEPTYVMLEGDCRTPEIERAALAQLGRRPGSRTFVAHFG